MRDASWAAAVRTGEGIENWASQPNRCLFPQKTCGVKPTSQAPGGPLNGARACLLNSLHSTAVDPSMLSPGRSLGVIPHLNFKAGTDPEKPHTELDSDDTELFDAPPPIAQNWGRNRCPQSLKSCCVLGGTCQSLTNKFCVFPRPTVTGASGVRRAVSKGVKSPAPNCRTDLRDCINGDSVSSMLYFAYGSNLNLAHFTAYLVGHGMNGSAVENPERAILPAHRLRTNYLSCVHQAGACNIEPAPGHAVEGVAMEITPTIRSALRRKEGWPDRYQEIQIEVIIPPAKNGVAAFTYVVNPAFRLPVDIPVTEQYRRRILDGAAHLGLSQSYRKALDTILRTGPAVVNVPA